MTTTEAIGQLIEAAKQEGKTVAEVHQAIADVLEAERTRGFRARIPDVIPELPAADFRKLVLALRNRPVDVPGDPRPILKELAQAAKAGNQRAFWQRIFCLAMMTRFQSTQVDSEFEDVG